MRLPFDEDLLSGRCPASISIVCFIQQVAMRCIVTTIGFRAAAWQCWRRCFDDCDTTATVTVKMTWWAVQERRVMCAAVVELTSVLVEDHLGAFRSYNDGCYWRVFARFMATYYNVILPRQTGSSGVLQCVGILYSCKNLKRVDVKNISTTV